MLHTEHANYQKSQEKILKIAGIQMKLIQVPGARQIVIFCPGFPESSEYNDQMITYITTRYQCSCIYPQYTGTRQSDGEFLARSPSDDIRKIMQYIRNGKIGDKKDIEITLIGSSFGGGVALSLSGDSDIGKIIALSPLTKNNSNVNWTSLLKYIQKNYNTNYRINQEGYKKLANGKMLNIPDKYPDGKVIIGAIQGDNEIIFEKTIEEAMQKNAQTIEQIELADEEKKHLSWNVINRSKQTTKEQLFQSLDSINTRKYLIDVCIETVMNYKQQSEVYGILSHGSRIFHESKKNNDVDIILVLNEPQTNDKQLLEALRDKYKEHNATVDITIVYKNKIDKGGVESFNVSTHGNYYSTVLATAKTIYGKNPFSTDIQIAIKKGQITQGFRGEVGKYTDRLNREIIGNKNEEYFKKYIERILISRAIAEEKITVIQSNYITTNKIQNIIETIGLTNNEQKEIKKLLNKSNRDESDRSNCMYIYNQIHIRSIESNNIKMPNKYLKTILSNTCKIREDISISCSKEKQIVTNPTIKIISCAGFEKGSRNKLEENQKYINNNQLQKLATINIAFQQIQSYCRDNFGKELQSTIFFGDYGIHVDNPEVLKDQERVNTKACNNIFGGNQKNSSLNEEFKNQELSTENQHHQYTIEDINQLMKEYGLSEVFINGYLQSSKNKEQKVINMIGTSINEHLHLTKKIIQSRQNTILIYAGNPQKIRLMNEYIKNTDNTILLVGINT